MYDLPKSIIVDIMNREGMVIDDTTASLASGGSVQTRAVVYEYSVWANLGEKLTFVPRDSRYAYFGLFVFITVCQSLVVTSYFLVD